MARVALVTGGTRGIGAGIARELKAAGYTVAVNYLGNEEVATKFRKETGIPTFLWSVADFESCKAGVEKITADLGPIEILVNNAGITRDGFMHKMSADQWTAVINTNLNSVFNMSRNVIEGMRERAFGRIISISSVNGIKGQMGQTNYSAAKAGIIGFTKALAQENATKGITVNAIAPGYIGTDMVAAMAPDVIEKIVAQVPVGRLGQVEEIARTVVFLASDDSGFITGATFNINGGQYMQ
jgi:acetoacetyl-CoA reductase